MPSIHEVLEDTQKQGQALLDEMKAFKGATSLQQKAAENLEAMTAALNDTAKAIKPFTESHFRRFQIFMVTTVVINTVLFLVILLILIFGK